MDVMEPFSSPTSPSNFSQRHFYLAVDRLQYKMETLTELLEMAGRRQFLPMVVCCSTRDELDAVCSAMSNLSHVSVATLYSDLAESERMSIMEKFRETATRWNRQLVVGEEGENEDYEERRSHMIVVTDACLPFVGSGEAVLNSRLLINYELPVKKETYMRRMASCLAAGDLSKLRAFSLAKKWKEVKEN